MRSLVTGGTGFIGSKVVHALLNRGHDVVAIVRDKTKLGRLQLFADQILIVESRLEHLDQLSEQLSALKIDSCIHLAWYAEPGKYLEAQDNLQLVQDSLQLMAVVAQQGCKRFVGAGTCAEYDTSIGYLRESGPVAPNTLYGSAKLALRYMGEQRARQLGISFAWGRVFYVYGPGEDKRRVVPAIVNCLLDGQTFGASTGEQIRDFMHVDDLAAGFVALAESTETGVFNIAMNDPITMRGLMEKIAVLLEYPDRVQFGVKPKNLFDPPFICGDNSRLRSIGWEPKFSLTEGLKNTIQWWKEVRS